MGQKLISKESVLISEESVLKKVSWFQKKVYWRKCPEFRKCTLCKTPLTKDMLTTITSLLLFLILHTLPQSVVVLPLAFCCVLWSSSVSSALPVDSHHNRILRNLLESQRTSGYSGNGARGGEVASVPCSPTQIAGEGWWSTPRGTVDSSSVWMSQMLSFLEGRENWGLFYCQTLAQTCLKASTDHFC